MESLCIGCSTKLPPAFLDLGRTPLANSYVRPGELSEPEPVFPLALAFCPGCYLVQLTERIDPSLLFDHYLYFSSYSDSYLAHARTMASDLIGRFRIESGSRVLEIASNDGYLLQYFQQAGIPVLGIEPAKNIAAVAQAKGIPTLSCYFGESAVDEILRQFGAADLILGNNVLAHVPDINGFLRAVCACLKPGGRAVFEFPDLAELLKRVEFDTIYHEHVFYYSLSAISVLARRNGFEVFDVEPQRVHGGSLRVFLGRPSEQRVFPAVNERLQEEKQQGLCSPEAYAGFAGLTARFRTQFLALLQQIQREGKRIAAYGAPAKGNTLLNYCGVKSDLIAFTVDRSSHKQGLLLPGSRIPILDPAELLRRQPDYAVILPWNLSDEIISQQDEYLQRGGKFIIPIPVPTIVGGGPVPIRVNGPPAPLLVESELKHLHVERTAPCHE